jgi:hypothetical protein
LWHRSARIDAPSACGEPARERWVQGGSRFEVEGDETHAAEETLRAPITAAVPTPDGWRWFTRGEVWASATWLGPLRRVAAWDDASPVPAPGRPVAVRDGRLLGAPSPPNRWVLTAGFVDESRGVALAEPGVFLETTDAGATWQRLPAPPSLVTDLTVSVRGIHALEDAAGRRWILRGRRWAPDPAPPTPDADGDLPDWRRRWSAAVPLSWDHARLALFGDHHVDVYDVATDRVVPTVAPPCGVDDAFFAGRLFAVCRGEHHDDLFAFDGTSWRRQMAFRSPGHGVCVASADGADLACPGSCGTALDGDARGVCVVRDGHAPETLRARGDDRFVPVGFRDGALVSVARGDTLGAWRVRVGDEAPRPLGDSWPVGPWAFDTLSPRLDHYGRLHLLARDGDDALVVFDGWPGGAWTRRGGPPLREAHLCGDEGVVLGRDDDGVVWASDDARGPWRRLGAFDRGRTWFTRLTCSAAGWRLYFWGRGGGGPLGADHVAWEGLGWGPVRTEGGTLRGAEPPAWLDAAPLVEPAGWRCALDGTVARAPLLRDDASLTARDGPRSITAAGLAATVRRASSDGEGLDYAADGVFVLDGAVGRLHQRSDGELVAVSTGGDARSLGVVRPRACEAGARGDLALRIDAVIEARTDRVSGALHLAVDRRGVCVPTTATPGPGRDGDGPIAVTGVTPAGGAWLAHLRRASLRFGLRCTRAASPH